MGNKSKQSAETKIVHQKKVISRLTEVVDQAKGMIKAKDEEIAYLKRRIERMKNVDNIDYNDNNSPDSGVSKRTTVEETG